MKVLIELKDEDSLNTYELDTDKKWRLDFDDQGTSCKIRVYDPIAMTEAKRILGEQDNLYFASDIYDAVLEADALLLVTEWKEFRLPSWQVVRKSMKGNLILDGRNIYDKHELLANGFEYQGIGLK